MKPTIEITVTRDSNVIRGFRTVVKRDGVKLEGLREVIFSHSMHEVPEISVTQVLLPNRKTITETIEEYRPKIEGVPVTSFIDNGSFETGCCDWGSKDGDKTVSTEGH